MPHAVLGRRGALALAAALIAAPTARAQSWPSRPVRLVVPYAAGGSSDVVGRLLAARLQSQLGQPWVVDNRAGAGSQLGTEAVARSAPDGHTLLLADTPFAILPAVSPSLPYNAGTDFTPLALVGVAPVILFAAASLPATDARAFVAAAKAAPETIAVASAGPGSSSHLSIERFALATGTRLTHVPYRGAAPAMTDLASGQVQAFFATIASGGPLLREGRIKALGVLSEQRLPALSAVPTLSEQGIDLVVETWFGLLGPAGLSPGVADRLLPELRGIVQEREVAERFAAIGVTPRVIAPAAFGPWLAQEIARWAEVVRAADIRLQ
jgi:tripartite-type tricarboxylate transporter receptor subunit TctC